MMVRPPIERGAMMKEAAWPKLTVSKDAPTSKGIATKIAAQIRM